MWAGKGQGRARHAEVQSSLCKIVGVAALVAHALMRVRVYRVEEGSGDQTNRTQVRGRGALCVLRVERAHVRTRERGRPIDLGSGLM